MIAGLNVWHNASSRGQPVIAIHGGCATGRIWETVSETFGDSVRFFAPDLPGHGGSPLDCLLGNATIVRYTDALVRLCKRFEPEHVDVLAHSMGGLPALQLAGRALNIRKIVLLNSAPPWMLVTPRTMLRALKYLPSFLQGKLWKYTKDDYKFLLCTSSVGENMLPELAERFYREQVHESGIAALQMCLGSIRPHPYTVMCPVMVVAARGDRLIPLRFQQRLMRRYNAHYYDFAGTHLSVFDPAYAWVWEHHIMPWLDKQ